MVESRRCGPSQQQAGEIVYPAMKPKWRPDLPAMASKEVDRSAAGPNLRAFALPAAGDALDLGLDDALDQGRQIVIQPGLQHRPQHLLDQILESPRIVAEHGVGQGVERG